MSEILSIICFIGFLAGQTQIISLAIKEKGFGLLKNAFVISYLLIGLNIPIIIYLIISVKYNKNIPLLSLLVNFYSYGIVLIGISSFIYDYYKLLKIKKSSKSLSNENGSSHCAD